MGDLIPITQSKKYVPYKVKASLFYGIDTNLDEIARSLYLFLNTVAIQRSDGTKYLLWPTMEDVIEHLNFSEWGKAHPTYAIRNAYSQLRKNKYVKHCWDRLVDNRVLELIEFVGENARN